MSSAKQQVFLLELGGLTKHNLITASFPIKLHLYKYDNTYKQWPMDETGDDLIKNFTWVHW